MSAGLVDFLPQNELNRQQQDINVAFNVRMLLLEEILQVMSIKITALEERLKALEGDGK